MKRISLKFVLLLTILTGAAAGYFWLLQDGLLWCDFQGQWQLCAYTLRGIDPFPQIGAALPADGAIGSIPLGWSAAPWGCLLGNLCYAGFLPPEGAKLYFLAANLLLLLLTAWSVYQKARRAVPALAGTMGLAALLSLDFIYAVVQGNAGGMICCLVLLAILWREKPVLSGLLLGLAMIKPQVALLICLVFLLDRRYIQLLIAAALTAVSWGAVSLLTHTGPLPLLREFLSAGSENPQFSGVFSLLGHALDIPAAGLLLSMLTGCLFVLVLFVKGRSLGRTLGVWAYVPACIASTCWCYTFLNDNYVMLLPSLLCLVLLTADGLGKLRTAAIYLAFLYCYFGRIVRSMLLIPFERLPLPTYAWHYGETVYEAGLLLLGIWLYGTYLRKKRENLLLPSL